MQNRDQFLREIGARSENGLDNKFVIGIVRHHDGDEDANEGADVVRAQTPVRMLQRLLTVRMQNEDGDDGAGADDVEGDDGKGGASEDADEAQMVLVMVVMSMRMLMRTLTGIRVRMMIVVVMKRTIGAEHNEADEHAR